MEVDKMTGTVVLNSEDISYTKTTFCQMCVNDDSCDGYKQLDKYHLIPPCFDAKCKHCHEVHND